MILRIWRGLVPTEQEADYVTLVRRSRLPGGPGQRRRLRAEAPLNDRQSEVGCLTDTFVAD